MMRLLVNADDYGLTKKVSLGIIDGMKHGVITSTSAIVCTTDFKESAKLALNQGVTRMGLHCLATMGVPILAKEQVTSLVNEQGNFYSREAFMKKAICVKELEQELIAQINLLESTGLSLSHLDTHHGFLCKNEEVFAMMMRLACQYQVPIRNEISRLKNGERDYYNALAKEYKVKMVDTVYFNHGSPNHTVEDIIAFLHRALSQCATVEIGCHPGISDDVLRSLSILNDDREKELDVMKSKELKEYIDGNEIELINYTKL